LVISAPRKGAYRSIVFDRIADENHGSAMLPIDKKGLIEF
jgi:hypothetical protein